LTILISLYILTQTYRIVKESINILMMSNSEEIDLNEIKTIVEKIPGVLNIHHIHLWKLNDNDTHFEAHIEVNNISIVETSEMQKQIEHKLHEKYEINHTTLQFECNKCIEKKLV